MPIKRMQEKQTNNSNEILGKVLKQLQEVTKTAVRTCTNQMSRGLMPW